MPKNDKLLSKLVEAFNDKTLESYDITAVMKMASQTKEEEKSIYELLSKGKDGKYIYGEKVVGDMGFHISMNNKKASLILKNVKEADLYEKKLKEDFGVESEFTSHNDMARLTYKSFSELKENGATNFPQKIKLKSSFVIDNKMGLFDVNEFQTLNLAIDMEDYYDGNNNFQQYDKEKEKGNPSLIKQTTKQVFGDWSHYHRNQKI